ncbi:methionine gamma-lyase [Metabacillus arenae]|uniref:L-methionine gamma-lyase n=1 Tax=Metabacillus arenae TaxID=2771434 RepID=A0A926NFG9_9BACI|nr:methionine gamma-lyase [Metabacillus arenae]MBD1380140.1 methionine gamma-lyase [Metabacillus arenae]
MTKKEIETLVIHNSNEQKEFIQSLTPPLYQTSTFYFDNAQQGEHRFAGNEAGFIYSRLSNPTVELFEEKMAVLEGGEKGLAFSSGMGAVSAVLFSLVNQKDHIICSRGVYGCTFGFLQLLDEKFGISHSFCDLNNQSAFEKAIKGNTKVIYMESPINPTMELIDLEMVTSIAKRNKIPVVVDNTFSSPYLQKPLDHGCNIVVHSATKYICGHGDVIGGVVVGTEEYIKQLSKTMRKDIGAVMSPFDSWLLLRGIKTLAVRMDRHCENAEYIAHSLVEHARIEKVYYPTLPDFEQASLARKQMKKGGGLISFTIKGANKAKTQQFMNQLKLIKIAVSLGDPETLIQHPASMTHSVVSEKERLKMGITDTMVRLSVGLENREDILEDIYQALNQQV